MSEDFTKLLEMATRTATQLEAIREDVAEIKTTNRDRLNVHSKRLGDLEHSRTRARTIFGGLGFLVTLIGGERLISWLGHGP